MLMPSFSQLVPNSIKAPARRLVWQFRRATWRQRCLPDFIIIGSQKSGTSSLFAYLSQHPQLHPAFRKEIHYFDGGLEPGIDTFKKGESWYRAHFPLRRPMGSDAKAYEASPLYIFNPLVAKRIYDLLPHIKLIAILRNPTERAVSHYFHERRKGRETLPIMDALLREDERMSSSTQQRDYKSRAYVHFAYKGRGLYKQQIDRYLRRFHHNRLLVISSEMLFGDTSNSLRKIFEFVGVAGKVKVKDLKPRNVAENRNQVDRRVYAYLDNYFAPYNDELYQLIGQNFNW